MKICNQFWLKTPVIKDCRYNNIVSRSLFNKQFRNIVNLTLLSQTF